ncbi:hypothetical protein GCM10022252_79160 [Streptosporangium oxazolinicum]|uniref:HTH tetR-type domain-containing protein n=1 Tax=Streptosporangium oxazolinicum TaxID=909287 RepID=A0ABP8BMZ9_9ACTN
MAGNQQRLSIDERRERLLAVGAHMFSRRPYHEIGVEELAEAAGTSNGLLYHYFKGKRQFYVAVVESAYKRLIEAVSASGDHPSGNRIMLGLTNFLTYVEEHSNEWTWLIRVAGSEGDLAQVGGEAERVFVEQIIGYVGRRPESPMLRNAVTGWVGFNENAARAWLARARLPARDAMARMMAYALLGALRGVAIDEPQALRPELAAALRERLSSPEELMDLVPSVRISRPDDTGADCTAAPAPG